MKIALILKIDDYRHLNNDLKDELEIIDKIIELDGEKEKMYDKIINKYPYLCYEDLFCVNDYSDAILETCERVNFKNKYLIIITSV